MIVWEPEVTAKIKELYIQSLISRTVTTPLGQEIYDNVQQFIRETSET
jgi:hypothetical protein